MTGPSPTTSQEDSGETSRIDPARCKDRDRNAKADKEAGEKDGSNENEKRGPSNEAVATDGQSTGQVPNSPPEARHNRLDKPPTSHKPPQQTPVPSSVPIQPYGYPNFYYAVPGYVTPGPPNPMTGTYDPSTYTDVSAMEDPLPDTRRNRGGVSEPFPQKLHRMLESCEKEGLSDIVSFYKHGRAFAIHQPRRFVSEVMPAFFRQSRLTSFQRQLNLYGFRRISQGPDNGGAYRYRSIRWGCVFPSFVIPSSFFPIPRYSGYYHELFLKGRPGLCVNMKRVKIKGTSKPKRDPETEPK